MKSLNYPQPDTLLIIRPFASNTGIGTPVTDHTGKGFLDYDGPPPESLKFQLLDSDNIDEILQKLRTYQNYTLNVVQGSLQSIIEI